MADSNARSPADSPVYRPEEVASMLGIKPQALRRWRQRGVGPPFVKETPRSTVYPKAGFERWLAENQRTQA